MNNKKIALMIIFGILIIGNLGFILGQEENPFDSGASYCCEKTKSGAFCQNSDPGECDEDFRTLETSCESTNFCKMGCCYNSQEGTCLENSPESVCGKNGGFWAEGRDCAIPQCAIACCLMGDQAAFVTQTRCKRLSTLYGAPIDFREDINDELTCIATASSNVVMGACVLGEEEIGECRAISQRECQNVGGEFHKDFLCTAESLGTICAPSDKTTCVDGKDEVYFLDSCGNVANIYDSSKKDDKEYWKKIFTKEESCGAGSSNADSKDCGNCDYPSGSTCKEKLTGAHYCNDLGCDYEGENFKHGESWCADSPGLFDNLPGSRAFRLVCYNGEVTSEACADFRQELCFEVETDEGLRAAGCGANLWKKCIYQNNKRDCENPDARDCRWIKDITPDLRKENEKGGEDGTCVPLFSPGLKFWGSQQGTGGSSDRFSARFAGRSKGTGISDAKQVCSQADKKCLVTWEEDFFGEKECIDGCECVEGGWKKKMTEFCEASGDCGAKTNFLGVQGYNKGPKVDKEDVEEKKSSRRTRSRF